MFKNRFLLILGILSLGLVALVVAKPFSKVSTARPDEATDFFQRHPDWMWKTSDENAVIPLTGNPAFPDYHQRHPELSAAVEGSVDTTDYFLRHPELLISTQSIDLTDYYFRHPELRTK